MNTRILGVVVTLALVAGCSQAATPEQEQGLPETLIVGLIPNISPEKQKAQYEPFRAYLADKLKVKVELFVATDYAGVVTALVGKKLDLAYLGGLTYAQAKQQAPQVTPLVTEIDELTGTKFYQSAIVTKAGAPYASTNDVVTAGARFAFGDVASTSGSLYPRIMLVDAGASCDTKEMTKCPPLKSVAYTGGHDAAAQAVVNGSADAAGLELRILRRLETQGTVQAGALKILETRDVMGYPWVAREGLSPKAREQVVAAFTGIADPKLLALMRAKSYTAVGPDDYKPLEDKAATLGLLTRG